MEDKASLLALTKSHTAEARTVLRARIMLACLEGKEMQQVARERKVSVPSVSKWRQRFARWGVSGLHDRARPGKPVRYDAAFPNRVRALLELGPRHPAGPMGTVRRSRKNSARAFPPSGVFCAAKESICSGDAVGA